MASTVPPNMGWSGGTKESKDYEAKYREQLQQKPGLLRTAIKEVCKVSEIRIKRAKYWTPTSTRWVPLLGRHWSLFA